MLMARTTTQPPSDGFDFPRPPRTPEEYRVWERTRLPEIERRLEEIYANMRWIAEGRYKSPGARIPFE